MFSARFAPPHQKTCNSIFRLGSPVALFSSSPPHPARARGSAADEVASHGSLAPSYASERSDEALAELATEFHGISVDLKTLMAGVDTSAVDDRGPVRSAIVDRAHDAGLDVFTWTLRPENRFLPAPLRRGGDVAAHGDWERWFTSIIRTGVDGVFADHTDLAVRARSVVGPGPAVGSPA